MGSSFLDLCVDSIIWYIYDIYKGTYAGKIYNIFSYQTARIMTRHCYDINKCKERKIFIFFEEGALKIHEFNIHFLQVSEFLQKQNRSGYGWKVLSFKIITGFLFVNAIGTRKIFWMYITTLYIFKKLTLNGYQLLELLNKIEGSYSKFSCFSYLKILFFFLAHFGESKHGIASVLIALRFFLIQETCTKKRWW